jgi:hypothetical protein
MTNEERDLIASFVSRVGGTPAAGVAAAGQGTVAPLPPVDREADALIADLFNRYPEARYRVTQMAFVQEHALVEAQNRIARLQWELQQAQQQAQAAAQSGAQSGAQPGAGNPAWGTAAGAAAGAAAAGQSRGIFGSLFGGSRPAAPAQPQYAPPPQYAPAPPQYPPQYGAPPPPQYPPGYNPAMFQQQGPGFFGSALRTAAGVAGGVVAADALMSLFSPHQGLGGGFGGGFGGGGFGGGGFGGPGVVENVTINNPAPGANPWGGDPMDAGGAPKDASDSGKFDAPPTVDQSAWSPAPDQGSGWQQADSGGGGWQDAPSDSGGGWDDASNDSSSDFSSDS